MTFPSEPIHRVDTLRGDVRPQPRKTAVIGGHLALLLSNEIPVGVADDGSFFPLQSDRGRPCHGFANGCDCGCTPRKEGDGSPRQPWETQAA